ncbi:SDR family NAD(P)-dependent oxidoreductase [Streptomyces coeruleorubidus]|uniref:SDR family NAD(P)-dependent oxidoreductase n=1 Tax=Streptomyces coeruleorubidus TaxID=116188 RepID=UPI003CD00627
MTAIPTARRLLGKLPFVDPGRPPLPARAAFLTGASSGIGKALAAELCARGYDVYLTARRIELLEELRAQLTAAFPQRSVTVAALDVTEHEAVVRTIDDAARQFGGLGMVIAYAGVDAGGNIGEGHFEAHRAVVDVNLLGAMATIDAAVAHFRSKGGGQVVGFSSVVAGAGLPGGAPYCASKAGLTRYLQSLRGELGQLRLDGQPELAVLVPRRRLERGQRQPAVFPGTCTGKRSGRCPTGARCPGPPGTCPRRTGVPGRQARYGPVTVSDQTLTVGNNSASLTVPWTDSRDGYTVTLLPPSNTTISTVAVAQHSGRCLDVSGRSTADGAAVIHGFEGTENATRVRCRAWC